MGRFSISSLVSLAAFASLAACLSILSGCERDPAPPLLDVTELQPHEVERGDRLEIRGRGFGEGHAAKLTFRGELHRAGQDATAATLETTGNATSRESIELTLSERLEALFCRDGDALAHTTFTGDLDVAFAPAAGNAAAPPVMATLHDVHLDVLPPVRERAKDDAAAEVGARFLASAGLTVDKQPAAAGGLMVTDVAKDSVAAHAGLVAGDRLTALDHLSLDSLADARPAGTSGAAVALFSVRSVDADLDRAVSLDCGIGSLGFGAHTGLAASAAIVGLALAMILLFVAPRSPYLAWIELRLAQRLRSRSSRLAKRRQDAEVDAVSSWRRASPLVVLLPFVCLPFADSFGLDLDVGLLFVLLATAIALASIFGLGDEVYKNTKERLRSLAARLFDQVPAAFALGCVVLLTGSLRLREIVRAQGGMPWDWSVFRTPLAFVLLIAWLSSALRADSDVRRRISNADHARGRMEKCPSVYVSCTSRSSLRSARRCSSAAGKPRR